MPNHCREDRSALVSYHIACFLVPWIYGIELSGYGGYIFLLNPLHPAPNVANSRAARGGCLRGLSERRGNGTHGKWPVVAGRPELPSRPSSKTA